MSDFAVEILPITIEEHPDADALELARVGDYRCIVQKGKFKSGDRVAYIPEASIVPDWLLKEMGLEGRLAGRQKNRVKAIKLRGIVSQGIVYPVNKLEPNPGDYSIAIPAESTETFGLWDLRVVHEGQDVAEMLGITKYVPPTPTQMQGEIARGDYFNLTFKYDFENVKKRNRLLEDGEEVVITEKIHGTFCSVTFVPDAISMKMGLSQGVLISSKGLFAKGHVFDNDACMDNLYVRTIRSTGLIQRVVNHPMLGQSERPIYLLGEIFGSNVQDLTYGADHPRFRLFDIGFLNHDGGVDYLPFDMFFELSVELQIPIPPVLYMGPYSKDIMLNLTDGPEQVSGKELHMREGVVVRAFHERVCPRYGRAIVKSVSEAYLLRKNGTEHN